MCDCRKLCKNLQKHIYLIGLGKYYCSGGRIQDRIRITGGYSLLLTSRPTRNGFTIIIKNSVNNKKKIYCVRTRFVSFGYVERVSANTMLYHYIYLRHAILFDIRKRERTSNFSFLFIFSKIHDKFEYVRGNILSYKHL